MPQAQHKATSPTRKPLCNINYYSIMKIIFTTKLKGNNNNWQFSEDSFSQVPQEPGVYIIGVKVKSITDKKETFYPIYVGETKNLNIRIQEHYYGKKSGTLNGNKEIFDLNINKIDSLFDSVNSFISKRPKCQHKSPKSPTIKRPKGCYKCDEEKKLYDKLVKEGNTLIWFPNPDFFNAKVGYKWKSILRYHDNDYMHSYSLLRDLTREIKSKLLLTEIVNSKQTLWNKYFFFYAPLEGAYLKLGEYYTKDILDKNKLYTIAPASYKNIPAEYKSTKLETNLEELLVNSFKIPANSTLHNSV